MRTELEINIKHTMIGWTSIGLVLLTILEIIAYKENTFENILIALLLIPIIAIFLIFYWIIMIYLWSAFLTVGNDIGTKIVNRITHKKEIQI